MNLYDIPKVGLQDGAVVALFSYSDGIERVSALVYHCSLRDSRTLYRYLLSRNERAGADQQHGGQEWYAGF